MPDVKVYMPKELMENRNFKRILQRRLKHACAEFLDCNDYEGKPLDMHSSEIDVMCSAYDSDADVGATVIIEVAGYSYPERMVNIEERLQAILSHVVFPVEVPLVPDKRRGSISFIPLRQGSWQATAE